MVDGNDIGKLRNHTLTGEGREEVKKVKHTEKQNSRRLSTTVKANFHPQPSTNLSPLTDSSLTSRFRLSLSMIYAFKALLPVSHAFQLVPIPYRSSNRSRIFISGTSNHSGNLFRLFISGCAVVWRAPDWHRTLADSCSWLVKRELVTDTAEDTEEKSRNWLQSSLFCILKCNHRMEFFSWPLSRKKPAHRAPFFPRSDCEISDSFHSKARRIETFCVLISLLTILVPIGDLLMALSGRTKRRSRRRKWCPWYVNEHAGIVINFIFV